MIITQDGTSQCFGKHGRKACCHTITQMQWKRVLQL
nr:unnamed protein product [Callosobruchus analis]